MIQAWQVVNERPGSAGYLSVSTRTYLLPDGTRADWDIFGGERSVAVVALTANHDVVLARRFRPGPGAVLDEIPGGYVEPRSESRAVRAPRRCGRGRTRSTSRERIGVTVGGAVLPHPASGHPYFHPYNSTLRAGTHRPCRHQGPDHRARGITSPNGRDIGGGPPRSTRAPTRSSGW
jgi:hypothetical protein